MFTSSLIELSKLYFFGNDSKLFLLASCSGHILPMEESSKYQLIFVEIELKCDDGFFFGWIGRLTMEPLGLLSVMKLPTDSTIKVSLILFDVVLCS